MPPIVINIYSGATYCYQHIYSGGTILTGSFTLLNSYCVSPSDWRTPSVPLRVSLRVCQDNK